MIGLGLVILGIVSGYLALLQFRDYEHGQNDFAPSDEPDVWWRRAAKVRRFNSHLDIWIFGSLSPVLIVIGIVELFR